MLGLSKFSEAVTQSRLEQPKGREDVAIRLVAAGVGTGRMTEESGSGVTTAVTTAVALDTAREAGGRPALDWPTMGGGWTMVVGLAAGGRPALDCPRMIIEREAVAD